MRGGRAAKMEVVWARVGTVLEGLDTADGSLGELLGGLDRGQMWDLLMESVADLDPTTLSPLQLVKEVDSLSRGWASVWISGATARGRMTLLIDLCKKANSQKRVMNLECRWLEAGRT